MQGGETISNIYSNRPPPLDPLELVEGPTLNIRTNAITKAEVIKAINNLKNGKVGGVDKLPPEAIKCLDDTHRHYGLPEKIIKIIKLLYENFTCQVIHGRTTTNSFPVTTGVRQAAFSLLSFFWL